MQWIRSLSGKSLALSTDLAKKVPLWSTRVAGGFGGGGGVRWKRLG